MNHESLREMISSWLVARQGNVDNSRQILLLNPVKRNAQQDTDNSENNNDNDNNNNDDAVP